MNHRLSTFAVITVLGSNGLASALPSAGPKAISDEEQRANATIPIDYQTLQGNNVLEVLSAYGIIVDENSKVSTHNEISHIDLNCFNCIIQRRDHNAALPNPENEILRAK